MDLDEILKRISSKGDIAVASLGLVAGYLLDLKFALAGLPAGTAAVLGATAGIGLKNGAQTVWDHLRTEAKQRASAGRQHGELERAAIEIESLPPIAAPWTGHHDHWISKLRLDHDLWVKGLITDDDFQYSIKEFLRNYRGLPASAREPANTPPALPPGLGPP